jgi:hypothetical protein
MNDPTRLWARLPAVHRARDGEDGYPLRALLALVAEQADEIERDIEGLWNDLFIETCDPWVVPYIGDLVDNRLLSDQRRPPGLAAELFGDLAGPDLRPPSVARTRADVAKTIYYRRRKGTLAMLEELARDVTGWPVHAVEFMARLGWSQNANHLRPGATWTRLRDPGALARLNGPFERAARTVDVRRICADEGWEAPANVGFFVWRLQSYPLERIPARRSQGSAWRFHFSPLGNRQPLFSRWRREGSETGLTSEAHVPAEIGCWRLHEELSKVRTDAVNPDWSELYGAFSGVPGSPIEPNPDGSLFVLRNDVPVRPSAIYCRRLDPWPGEPERPSGEVVAVDPASGRLALGDGFADPTRSVDVSFHYGFAANLGGGPYERRAWQAGGDGAGGLRLRVREGPTPDGTEAAEHSSLVAALSDWEARDRPDCVITILDSRTYELPASIELDPGRWLAIEAANLRRPLLRAESGATGIGVTGGDPATSRAALTLSGALVEGGIRMDSDGPRLRLLHCTLVPGRALGEDGAPTTGEPSLLVEDAAGGGERRAGVEIEVAFSICGALHVSDRAERITLLDSIVDGVGGVAIAAPDGSPSTRVRVERCTLLGGIEAYRLDLSESIVAGVARAIRTEQGCVRFSFVAPGSTTPRRYRCQPDLAIAAAVEEAERHDPQLDPTERARVRERVEHWLVPQFTATRYGRPGYCQLRLSCPEQIGTGAAEGGEMGAFGFVGQAQRESNLRIRLEEYLPVGLEAGWIYVT